MNHQESQDKITPQFGTQMLQADTDQEQFKILIGTLDLLMQKQNQLIQDVSELNKCVGKLDTHIKCVYNDVNTIKLWQKDIELWKTKISSDILNYNNDIDDLKEIKVIMQKDADKRNWKRDLRNSIITAIATSVVILGGIASFISDSFSLIHK